MVGGVARYRARGQVYAYDRLREVTEAEVAVLPSMCWRTGRFDFDDYLAASVMAGTIEVVPSDTDEESRAFWSQRGRYRLSGVEFTYDELRSAAECEAAEISLTRWLQGEFNFNEWLTDSLLVGTIEIVTRDDTDGDD